MTPDGGGAAAARLQKTSLRLAALRDRMARLSAGEPVSLADVARAQVWAAAQDEETARATVRLRRSHVLAAERESASATVLDHHGAGERANRLRAAAARHLAAADDLPTGAPVRRGPPPGADSAAARPVWVPALSSMAHQLSATNSRLRALISAVGARSGIYADAGLDDLRRGLWEALADECAEESWNGLAEAVCRVAVRGLDSVDGAAIASHDERGHLPLAASDRWTEGLEELQMLLGDGPSIDVHHSGRPLVVSDVEVDRERWPGWSSATARHGLGAVWSVPLRLSDGIGVLTLYRREPGWPMEMRSGAVWLAAELAAAALAAEVRDWPQSFVPGRYPFTVDIAAGILSARLGTTPDEAAVRLRAYAFGTGQRLRSLADAVMRGADLPL